MATHFWSREQEVLAWSALADARNIIRDINQYNEQLATNDSLVAIASGYTKKWHIIDREYRKFRAKYDGKDKINKLSRYTAASYRGFQNDLNDRFLNKLEAQGTCAIDGIDPQVTFWQKHILPLKKT